MKRIASSKSVLLGSLLSLSYVLIIILSSCHSPSQEVGMPYPTKQVANDIDEEWGIYHVLVDREGYRFWYRLNFGFPRPESEEYKLRSIRVIDRLPPAVVKLFPDQIRIYTLQGDIDVSKYFEITSSRCTDTGIETLEIVALNTALENPRFYGRWADLYVEFEVGIATTLFNLSDGGYEVIEIVDMDIPSNFRVIGEYYHGEKFEKISNTVQTYVQITSLYCGCRHYCLCDRPSPLEGEYGNN